MQTQAQPADPTHTHQIDQLLQAAIDYRLKSCILTTTLYAILQYAEGETLAPDAYRIHIAGLARRTLLATGNPV